MRVNATGLFIITRAFGDLMAENKAGSIINIGSIQGMIGPDPTIYRGTGMSGFYPDYFFHKGGVINFTRFIASYYGAERHTLQLREPRRLPDRSPIPSPSCVSTATAPSWAGWPTLPT